jgi:hypothetical protein
MYFKNAPISAIEFPENARWRQSSRGVEKAFRRRRYFTPAGLLLARRQASGGIAPRRERGKTVKAGGLLLIRYPDSEIAFPPISAKNAGMAGAILLIIDSAQNRCIVHSHPSDKNKDVARVGHPDNVATQKGRINSRGRGCKLRFVPSEPELCLKPTCII